MTRQRELLLMRPTASRAPLGPDAQITASACVSSSRASPRAAWSLRRSAPDRIEGEGDYRRACEPLPDLRPCPDSPSMKPAQPRQAPSAGGRRLKHAEMQLNASFAMPVVAASPAGR